MGATWADERALYVVTGNAHKVEEFERLLPFGGLRSLRDHPLPFEPIEDGVTFIENSLIKSRAGLAHARSVGLLALALADDSGLEVDALDGAPGVLSARYTPGTDVDRYLAVLSALEACDARSSELRTARFRCALSLTGLTLRDEERLFSSPELAARLERADQLSWHSAEGPNGVLIRSVCALGTLEGSIALSPSGAEGFGYDPIFIPKGHQRPVACLPPAEKDALSHRGDALSLLMPVLTLLASESELLN